MRPSNYCMSEQLATDGHTSVTTMCITLHPTVLLHDDRDASLAIDRGRLGLAYGRMRGVTVGPSDQPGTSIVLEPPSADAAITDDDRRPIAEVMAAKEVLRNG
jgi:hypothetical protein